MIKGRDPDRTKDEQELRSRTQTRPAASIHGEPVSSAADMVMEEYHGEDLSELPSR
jgi:hypothetical protein